MGFNLKLELTDINVFGLVPFFVVFFSQTAFAQSSCSNPINGFCKVVPTEKFDMDNGGLVLPANGNIPPSGTPQNCKAFNEDPKHSCAVSFFVRNPIDNVSSVSGQIKQYFNSYIQKDDQIKFYAKIDQILKSYRSNVCNNGPINACIGKRVRGYVVHRGPQAENNTFLNELKALNKFTKEDYFSSAKNKYSEEYRLSLIQFNNYDLSKNLYPASFSFYSLDSGADEVKRLFLSDLLSTSGGDFYEIACHSLPVIYPDVTTTARILFNDSTDEFATTSDTKTLTTELGKYLPTPSSTPFDFKVDQITITATSSTGSNTKNFCQKDFINLNRARAEKVKRLIIDKFKVSENIFTDPNIGGTSGDGSAGICAYTCVEDSSDKTICNEIIKKPSLSNLNDYQRVTVTLKRTPNDSKKMSNCFFSLRGLRHDLYYKCENEKFKDSECLDLVGKKSRIYR